MNWTLWLKGLAAVAIGGAASGAASALSAGQLNQNTAIIAAIGALSTVLAYLVKSPLDAPAATTDANPVAGASNVA